MEQPLSIIIEISNKHAIVIANCVSIGRYALLGLVVSFFWGEGIWEGLKIGNKSNIRSYSYIGCSAYIEIGNNVMISPRVSIYAENYIFEFTNIPMKDQGITREFVIIEDDCRIAANSIILARITVGRGSIWM